MKPPLGLALWWHPPRLALLLCLWAKAGDASRFLESPQATTSGVESWGAQTGTPPRSAIAWLGPDRPAAENEATLAQIRANAGLFTAVYVGGCGLHTDNTDLWAPKLTLDDEQYRSCSAILTAAKEQGLEVQMWMSPAESNKVIPRNITSGHFSVDALVESSAQLAKAHGWDGINFDDEIEHGASRCDKQQQVEWLDIVDAWARGLHAHTLKLTVDILFVTCTVIRDTPCDQFKQYPCLGERYARTAVDLWLAMDTYEESLEHFYDNLDWYMQYFPRNRLAIGVFPGYKIDYERWLARFYAIEKSGLSHVAAFRLPIGESSQFNDLSGKIFLSMLRRWRGLCNGCPKQGLLDCWAAGHKFPASKCELQDSNSTLRWLIPK